jgi:tetratricopeptide (TPR) repeat protein
LTLAALSIAGLYAAEAFAAAGGGSMPRPDVPRPSPSQAKTKKEQARETDFEKAEYLIKGEQYEEAIPILQNVVADNPRDADAWNYLGYCTRKLGRKEESLGYYQKALAINPKHKGAHEYLGELYLMMGDLPKAEQQLAILQGLCPSGCEELEDLEADIAAFKANGGKVG